MVVYHACSLHKSITDDRPHKIKAILEVAGVGQIAIFSDPSGNALGLIQPPPDAE